jgi:hypothetical protein
MKHLFGYHSCPKLYPPSHPFQTPLPITNVEEPKNYIFRVNTILDKNGNVKSAQYGKIYGDFEEVLTTYFNPEPNSRELEYDMQHNLGPGGKNSYFTY